MLGSINAKVHQGVLFACSDITLNVKFQSTDTVFQISLVYIRIWNIFEISRVQHQTSYKSSL